MQFENICIRPVSVYNNIIIQLTNSLDCHYLFEIKFSQEYYSVQ